MDAKRLTRGSEIWGDHLQHMEAMQMGSQNGERGLIMSPSLYLYKIISLQYVGTTPTAVQGGRLKLELERLLLFGS